MARDNQPSDSAHRAFGHPNWKGLPACGVDKLTTLCANLSRFGRVPGGVEELNGQATGGVDVKP